MVDNTSAHRLGGRYEVRSLIGRGGMAQVHLGYDTRLHRIVAIKMLRTDLARDSTFQARFRREAQSAASLNHPNIVAVYDTGEEIVTTPEGQGVSVPYIVMEYVEGHTVKELLGDGTPVPINEAVEIVSGVLAALDYSHAAGLVHRDIKPGNIMLTSDGKVKVMDFGIARALSDSQATMTQTNAVVGTAQYLSPEQARGEEVDARSDLYSTGCVLFELLTGRPPFRGDSAVAVAYQHVTEQAPRPSSIAPDIPEALDRVVMKALAKDRDDRYSSAAQMRADLVRAAHGGDVDAPPTQVWNAATRTMPLTPPPPPGATRAMTATQPGPFPEPADAQDQEQDPQRARKRTRRRWLIAALVVLALALVGLGVWALTRNHEPATVAVPDVVGSTEAEARQTIEGAGLKFATGSETASDTVDEGHVVTQEPPAKQQVQPDSTVTVHLSSGPADVDVPDVTGQDQDSARQAIEAAGLKVGSVGYSNDSSQAANRVVKTDPEAGTPVSKGSSVNLVIASGNVELPDVRGQSESQATATLTKLGFTVRIQYAPSGDVDRGVVWGMDPDPGLQKRGTAVTLTVSSGTPSQEQTPSESPSQSPSESPSGSPSTSPSPSTSTSAPSDGQ